MRKKAGCDQDDARLGELARLFDGVWSEGAEMQERLVLSRRDRQDLERARSPLVSKFNGSWDITHWASVDAFKKWWNDVTIPIMGGTVWPVECEASEASTLLPKEQKECVLDLTDLKGEPTVDEAIVDRDFAILVGGKGSPPHVDTITNILSKHKNAEGHDDWSVELTLAVGYLIQGFKYFWALPPRGQQVEDYLKYQREHEPVGLTAREKAFRADILNGRIPHPFQGRFSMGWSSEAEWRDMRPKGINIHLHKVLPGDVYIVAAGTFHAVFNDADKQPASAAHDDAWVGGHPTLQYLKKKLGSHCFI